MAALERFSTAGLRPRQRVEAWNELCSSRVPIAAQPHDLSTFEPSCTRGSAGGLRLCEFNSSPSTVDHTSAHVARTSDPHYILHLQVEGTSVNRQGGREAYLQPGDITLLGTMQPYQMVFGGPSKALVLALSEALLRREIPCPDGVLGVRMRSHDNLVRMLFDLATGLWRVCGTPGLEDVDESLSRALYQLIGCAYTKLSQRTCAGSSSLEARRFQVMAYIENQLRDNSLSLTTIAAHFKASARSLHMLFSNGPETLSRYILRRRLEESARALTSPVHQARTISDLAFDHGFSSSAHFCKVFRAHFGATPTDYRRQQAVSSAQP